MLPRKHPDRIKITFDDHRLVANAGLILPATLAQHLGLGELVDYHLDLGSAPGRANTGDKMMTLVASALAGGDCIDNADALRTGGTACTLRGAAHFLRETVGRVRHAAVLLGPVGIQQLRHPGHDPSAELLSSSSVSPHMNSATTRSSVPYLSPHSRHLRRRMWTCRLTR